MQLFDCCTLLVVFGPLITARTCINKMHTLSINRKCVGDMLPGLACLACLACLAPFVFVVLLCSCAQNETKTTIAQTRTPRVQWLLSPDCAISALMGRGLSVGRAAARRYSLGHSCSCLPSTSFCLLCSRMSMCIFPSFLVRLSPKSHPPDSHEPPTRAI